MRKKVDEKLNNTACKRASSTIYMIFFLVIFLAFAAFAVDGTIVFTNRLKLQNATEMTALAAAEEFKANSSVNATDITQKAQDTFNLLKQDSLKTAVISTNVNMTSNKVLVTTQMVSEPFFLSFIGVSGINLEAKACAISEELSVTANYPGINWLTTNAAYLSDILSKNLNMNDTAILYPLGDTKSASYDEASGFVNFSLIDSEDDKPLSLGPGGFVTIKLPAPIMDKPGDDLFIKEAGDSLEGYMVFAGLDNDPDNPYVDKDKIGSGISWINISCAGTPEKTDGNGLVGSYNAPTDNLSNQDKFYGSGYFDIGASCLGGISMAKYLRIVDDNSETGFVSTDGSNFHKAMLYGEASTTTSGADIDSIKVLNHVRLLPSSGF